MAQAHDLFTREAMLLGELSLGHLALEKQEQVGGEIAVPGVVLAEVARGGVTSSWSEAGQWVNGLVEGAPGSRR